MLLRHVPCPVEPTASAALFCLARPVVIAIVKRDPVAHLHVGVSHTISDGRIMHDGRADVRIRLVRGGVFDATLA